MKIAAAMRQGVLIVRMEGEFDLFGAEKFQGEVGRALDVSGAKRLLLDFKKVSFIDSSGIGVILGRYKRLTAGGGEVMLVNLSAPVKKIFKLSGVLTIMTELDSEESIFS